ncbi:unnamed protein product [Calypogeia fissa]
MCLLPADQPQKYDNVHRVLGRYQIERVLEMLAMAKRLDVAECFAYEAARLVDDPDYGGDQVVSALYLQTEQLWLQSVQVSNFMRTAPLQAGAMMPAPGNKVTQNLPGSSSPSSSIAGIERSSSVDMAQLSDIVGNAHLQAEAMMTAPRTYVTQNLLSSFPSSSTRIEMNSSAPNSLEQQLDLTVSLDHNGNHSFDNASLAPSLDNQLPLDIAAMYSSIQTHSETHSVGAPGSFTGSQAGLDRSSRTSLNHALSIGE